MSTEREKIRASAGTFGLKVFGEKDYIEFLQQLFSQLSTLGQQRRKMHSYEQPLVYLLPKSPTQGNISHIPCQPGLNASQYSAPVIKALFSIWPILLQSLRLGFWHHRPRRTHSPFIQREASSPYLLCAQNTGHHTAHSGRARRRDSPLGQDYLCHKVFSEELKMILARESEISFLFRSFSPLTHHQFRLIFSSLSFSFLVLTVLV